MVRVKPLAASLLIALGGGGLSGLLIRGSVGRYQALRQPPLSPPGWVFPLVWTVLYLLMGVAAYLVWERGGPGRKPALLLYGLQLGMNFLWAPLFFRWGMRGLALVWLLALWALAIWTALRFYRASRPAGWLLAPYLLWLAFAAYLNAGVWLLNRG